MSFTNGCFPCSDPCFKEPIVTHLFCERQNHVFPRVSHCDLHQNSTSNMIKVSKQSASEAQIHRSRSFGDKDVCTHGRSNQSVQLRCWCVLPQAVLDVEVDSLCWLFTYSAYLLTVDLLLLMIRFTSATNFVEASYLLYKVRMTCQGTIWALICQTGLCVGFLDGRHMSFAWFVCQRGFGFLSRAPIRSTTYSRSILCPDLGHSLQPSDFVSSKTARCT